MYKSKKRNSKIHCDWKIKVFKKDNYQCQNCFSKEKLVAHHIIPWEENEKLRFTVSNGKTLCRRCHARHHNNRKGIKGQVAWNKGLKGLRLGWPKGKKFSIEHCNKISKSKKGKISWNKGIKGEKSHMTGKNMPHKGKTWIIVPDTGKRKWVMY